jgi:division protein CdvB (Snf7/Vps24/ESCRT-III family)
MSEVVWQSTITKDMVRHLSQDIIDELIEELNEIVASVAEEYEIE